MTSIKKITAQLSDGHLSNIPNTLITLLIKDYHKEAHLYHEYRSAEGGETFCINPALQRLCEYSNHRARSISLVMNWQYFSSFHVRNKFRTTILTHPLNRGVNSCFEEMHSIKYALLIRSHHKTFILDRCFDGDSE